MRIAATILMVLALAAGPRCSEATAQPPPVPAEEQPEVLTSGPVHEAFAEPVELQDQPGLVAPQEPPAKIEETPPADRPQGDQFVWVPGYWSWDADRNGYIWVSACWRAAPPGTYWVPGYWARVPGGWEWVAGFWAPTGTQKIQYLPAPPTFEDVQPPGPPPSGDVIWVPPCQYWNKDHYVLRLGYWLREQEGWIWVPSHYIWTPHGYVFVEGRWDYSLGRRGLLFAPVYFPRAVYLRKGFTYSPSIVIDIGALRVSLFADPGYCHYYFGDYYDDVYRSRGIYPWFESERSHTWYDPIFTYDVWKHRGADPQWAEHQRQEYDRRRTDVTLRPARTYRDMETRVARAPEAERKDVQAARPLTAAIAAKSDSFGFQRMNSSAQRKLTTQATDVQKFRDQRNKWESTATTQKAAQPAPERKGPVTSTPQAERGQPPATPGQGKTGTASPPAERGRGTATPPTVESKKVAASPPAAGRTPPAASPHVVPLTKPETVSIPKSPIVAKPASNKREAAPPAKPTEEHQSARDTKKQDTSKTEGKDKSK